MKRNPAPNNAKPWAIDRCSTVLLVLLSLGWGYPVAVAGQESRCADCHFATLGPYEHHIHDWQLSAHGRNRVGCEACHGGDGSTFESMEAHEGILSSANPSSPTHFTNLPTTCGRCHPGQLQAFRKSRHLELLTEGGQQAPSCSTCHSAAGSFLLSSRGLERACRRCHGEGKRSPRPELPSLGRTLHEEVIEVRELLETGERLIARAAEGARRRGLEGELAQARVPLEEAVESAHDFTFLGFDERLQTARERAEALLVRLAQSEATEP